MPRRRGSRNPDKSIYNPMPGDFAWTKEGRKCRVANRDRKDGINMAYVRYVDEKNTASGPYDEVKVRDLLPTSPDGVEEKPAGVVRPPKARKPLPQVTFVVVNTVNTPLNRRYDFGIHKAGCPDVRRDRKRYGCALYNHFESTPEEVRQAEINDLASGGFGEAANDFNFKIFPCCQPKRSRASAGSQRRSAAKTPDLQGDHETAPQPLQTEPGSGTVSKAKRQRATPNIQQRRTTVARRTASTKEAPAATKTRGRRSKAVEAEPETNGEARERLTHEDKLKMVPEVVKLLKGGMTFTEIRKDPRFPSSGLRKALYEKGYDTKGNKIDSDDDLSELEGKKLAQAVAKMREDGAAWYRIELAADMGQAELKDLLIDHGYEEFAEGRVSRAADEEEVEEAPKRTRSSGRKRGAAKTEEKAEPAAKATGRKRGRRRANPSDED